jgi:uncharacterized protein
VKTLDVLATVLLVIGGLNWALAGVARSNLVAAIFGMHFTETSALTSAVYLLLGLSVVCQAVSRKAIQSRWSGHPAMARCH